MFCPGHKGVSVAGDGQTENREKTGRKLHLNERAVWLESRALGGKQGCLSGSHKGCVAGTRGRYCNRYRVLARTPVTGVSLPQQLGTSALWHLVARSGERALDKGQKACTEAGVTLMREVTLGESLISWASSPSL